MTTGTFITFEGGEGAGKSLQLGWLADVLRDAGLPVARTREPGGCAAGEAVRGLLVDGNHAWSPVSEAFLHCAARGAHVRDTIAPALAAGTWVLCDRFADSTLAYQGHGHGLDRAFLQDASDRAADGLRPDLTIVLDVPPAEGLARAGVRGGETPYEALPLAFHERVRAGFLEIAAVEPERCRVVDAGEDAQTIHRAVVELVRDRFKLAL